LMYGSYSSIARGQRERLALSSVWIHLSSNYFEVLKQLWERISSCRRSLVNVSNPHEDAPA
jgi:hypothetical protein